MINILSRILIFLLISNVCYAQDLILKCDNVQPRVGQSITISLQVEFMEDIILSNIPFDYESSKFMTVFDNKTFDKQITVMDTGVYKIGPIEMTYNNKTFRSNELTLKILPPLPDKDGIWLRFIKNDEKKYIVLEQNILVKLDEKVKGDKIVFQMEKLNSAPIAEIDISSIKAVSLKQVSSNASSRMVKDGQPFNNLIKTSIIVYEIVETSDKIMTITEKNMNNLKSKKKFREVSFEIE